MGITKSGVVINSKTSGKADIDKYSLFKYNSLDPENKEIVKARAKEVVRLIHELQEQKQRDQPDIYRQGFGFNSALSLLLVLDTLHNQESA